MSGKLILVKTNEAFPKLIPCTAPGSRPLHVERYECLGS